jgi:hypothetical protein
MFWPFNETSDNLINIFNEVMNSSYLCIYLALSGLQATSEIREKLGWALVCVSLITVFINFAKLIFVKVRALAKYLTRKRTENINIIEQKK